MILLVRSNPNNIFLYYGPASSLLLLELRDCIPFNSATLWPTIFIIQFYSLSFARDETKAVPSVLCEWHLQQRLSIRDLKGLSEIIEADTFVIICSPQCPRVVSMKVEGSFGIGSKSSSQALREQGSIVAVLWWLNRSVVQDMWKHRSWKCGRLPLGFQVKLTLPVVKEPVGLNQLIRCKHDGLIQGHFCFCKTVVLYIDTSLLLV